MNVDVIKQGQLQLSTHDSVMAQLIAAYGDYTVAPHDNYYQELVSSIIGQQLSVKAAATIERRFVTLFGETFPTPEQIVATDIETMRSAGLSKAKAMYVIDLARHVLDGRLKLDEIAQLSNEEIIRVLTDVKGIGVWTAHMFLIFGVGRLDVLPVGDLGVRTGVKRLYDFDDLPSPLQLAELAASNGWHSYESIAAWYIWKSLDNTPQSTA